MPTPLAKGVIIAASVLVAASIAAYENPHIREWFERSSQKVALAFRSLGEEIHGRRRRESRQDSSMREDGDEQAEERRRQARQEIMEKGRILEEKRKRKRQSTSRSRTTSFDSMVDDEGRLRKQMDTNPWAASSAVDHQHQNGLRARGEFPQMHESVDAPILLRQLNVEERPTPVVQAIEPWESQYEQEMRNAWNIDIPAGQQIPSTHASESLIDLTPTTEDFPDPDYSVPLLDDMPQPWQRTEYFSAAASQISHTLSEEHEVSNPPLTSLDPRPFTPNQPSNPSANASIAGSTAYINHSEAELTDDDMSDEYGDGIRTPASAWTEVASSVSGDD